MFWYKCGIQLLFPLVIFAVGGSDEYDEYEELLTDENFNKTWIYFPDDDGTLHKAIIAEIPKSRLFVDVAEFIKYTLYTRENPLGEPLEIEHNLLERTCLKFTRPTKIITHGWMSNGNRTACVAIRKAYMEEDDYNIIVMDWSPIASGLTYVTSVWFVDQIGNEVAKFIDNMMCQGADAKDIHMIGHSMGAHIFGVAGRYFKDEKIYRVTGLDPAGPLFEVGFAQQLSNDSADFVDVIHTATGSVGFTNPLGTVDFYPNGGRRQPHCVIIFLMSDIGCDHASSWKYFRTSILEKYKYPSAKCPSFAEFKTNNCSRENAYMGNAVSTNIKGDYFLEIKDIV